MFTMSIDSLGTGVKQNAFKIMKMCATLRYYNLRLLPLFLLALSIIKCDEVDPNGYVAYCPCMGRFGNQAEYFLGSLAFAHGLNRTLILPPWVEYRQGSPKSIQVPFDSYFKVEPLMQYHRVITMEEFMEQLAPTLWPPGNRIVFCYMARESTNDCQAKEGNPFGPFWDTFGIDFDRSEFYEPLHYDIHHQDAAIHWNKRYLASQYPVLAFMGAPASFPIQSENRALHRYMEWSTSINQKADSYIKTTLPKGPFVGIHLRNGIDWTRACEHVNHAPNLFAAPQCLGYRNEHGKATAELCFPSKQTILKQVKRAIKDIKAKAVFVASDNDHMIEEFNRALKKLKVRAYHLEPSNPHVDLAILGRAHHFIGNCISTFSGFVKRERDVSGFPSSFWAFPIEEAGETKSKDEL